MLKLSVFSLSCSALGMLIGCGSNATEDLGVSAAALVQPSVRARVETAALHSYDEAPRAVDSDDPAIWINPKRNGEGLVIGALKDAGIQVYDLSGRVVQTIVPAFRLAVSAQDPKVPGPQPDAGTRACPDSESGETFGRFNNVDVAYDFVLRDRGGKSKQVDVAIVTDRGCDRLRIFAIDPENRTQPLKEITSSSAPRVYPKRWVQPWSVLSGANSVVEDNPLDDQSTAYGLALYRPAHSPELHAFVTQRSRSVVSEFVIAARADGSVSYEKVRELRFKPEFSIAAATGRARSLRWTPCREDASEDPQFEGLVVDAERGVLYAAQEVVGIWKLPLADLRGSVVNVSESYLLEPVKSFGAPYWAVPDDGEFACETTPPSSAGPGVIAVEGNPRLGGKHIAADVEGLAIYYGSNPRSGYLIVSSQGDDTFHVYDRKSAGQHLAEFTIEGSGETDGHDVVNVPAGKGFPLGLFVAQNGKANAPESEEPVNGYEYDNSTQFKFLRWDDIARTLKLDVDTRGYDPRAPNCEE